MNLKSNLPNIHFLQSPPHTFLHKPNFPLLSHRTWKHRRLKPTRIRTIRNHINTSPPFETIFQNIITHFPSLETLSPPIAFLSGVISLYLYTTPNRNADVSPPPHYLLLTSPTPFNRFVFLRCPSISISSENLVKEDPHLLTGRIVNTESTVSEFVYQRVCVGTEDGGVVSLDWPDNLDLEAEHGLDTTVFVVPGTVEGSMDENVRSFVTEALRRGCFPIVMNPRGCAGSPLTTARLFTAADSDDISTAIQFISKARPWSTLMGVGWGYGANMLTKYLAEVGEKTPLTAATCIDSPFDLEDATRSSPYHIAFDQKLTSGLINILRSNKELFQGRAKGFDVEKALLATSVRDFEKAISMVSYGFDAIEDFYTKCSTRDVIGNVKIPVLFVQNDDGTVPILSIPRNLIAENPFTSLLLHTCLPSDANSGRFTLSWCQHLILEWLAAVELGLLKGRHPLLEDVDVTINPSKSLSLVKNGASNKSDRVNKLLTLPHSDALNGTSLDLLKEMLPESDAAAGTLARSGQHSWRNFDLEDKELQQENNGALQRASSVNAEIVEEEVVSPVDGERGEMLQTAQVVMNMLDVTLPGTLAEQQKKMVLTAVNKGETLMKALQDAVPEDVREKLTTAATGIFQNQGSNLKLDGLLSIGQIPNVASGLKSKIQGKDGLSSTGGNEDHHSSDHRNRVNDLADISNKTQFSTEKPSGDLESEPQPSENFQYSVDTGPFQSSNGQGSAISDSGKDAKELMNNNEHADFSKEKASQSFENEGHRSETGADPDFLHQTENDGGTEDVTIDQDKARQDGAIAQLDVKEEKEIQQNEEKNVDSSITHDKMVSSSKTEEISSPQESSLESPLMEKEGSDNHKWEEKSMQPVQDQNNSNMQTFSVSQALDAFTEIDDSTQVAVNSVFNVIEGMITQLEGESENEIEVKDRNKVEDQKTGSVSENLHITNEDKLERKVDYKRDLDFPPDMLDDLLSRDRESSDNDLRARRIHEKYLQNSILLGGNNIGNLGQNIHRSLIAKENRKKEHLVGGNLNSPLYITTNPHGDPLYKEYLRKYLISKMASNKPLDLDTTTALFLDYFPEEDQWKLFARTEHTTDSTGNVGTREGVGRKGWANLPSKVENEDNIIEPSYIILDTTEKQEEPSGGHEIMNKINEKLEIGDDTSEKLTHFVKRIILDTLKVEVGRKLNAADLEEMEHNLARDVEHVANSVSHAIGNHSGNMLYVEGNDHISGKVGTLHGELTISAISSAVQNTSYLRRILPVGAIVGSSLAALRKFFDVAPVNGNGQAEDVTIDQGSKRNLVQAVETETDQMPSDEIDQKCDLDGSISKYREKAKSRNLNNDTVMVGAVTAVIGASAILVHQQDSFQGNETLATLSKSFKEKENHQQDLGKFEEEISEKSQSNIVTSLAEKAMSVAGPVVPTKEDGAVDQERLVAMLAELGQKGGILKLVGKIALLWGGIRGAMSLTNKLISFLRLSERPLFQRILGFVCMVFVLWSPVVVPLLPTFVQGWATHSSSKMAELACIIGLYVSIMILVMLWGKRIRGFESPLEQYGLDLDSLPKIQNFLKGLIGGVMLVLLIQSVNSFLGCVHLSWLSTSPSTSVDSLAWLKVYGKMLILIGQGFVTATGVAIVEELLFRSWLPDEIAADLGYHRGIIISGLAFALSQRSPWAIPALWLLSIALSGARQRSEGSLSLPIGLRAGILASSFILQKGAFLSYRTNFPVWATGTHPLQPFSGIVGLASSLLLVLILYPRQPLHGK